MNFTTILISMTLISGMAFATKAKIAVLTAVIGGRYQKSVLSGVRTKESYCRIHGYDFHCLKDVMEADRSYAWQKIPLIKSVLRDYDWIMWSDADSLFMEKDICLEEFINVDSDLVICFDNCSNVVNSGQFFIKNSELAFQFLEKVWNKTQYINHPWWENAAIIDVLSEAPFNQNFCEICPQRSFNSFAREINSNRDSAYSSGDFLVHFPSVRDLDCLQSLMEKYERESAFSRNKPHPLGKSRAA